MSYSLHFCCHFNLNNSRLFRKWKINSIITLLAHHFVSPISVPVAVSPHSLSACFPSCVCGSRCLQRSCLSQRLHSHIGLIAPQGVCPHLWTVGRHFCHPEPYLCFWDKLQLLEQLEVSSRSSSAYFNLPLTHSPRHPFNSHTLKSVHASVLFAKESNISSHSVLLDRARERGQ